ncbi:diguanylate cyclase domain-containing protein [Nakamurella alba]|uniref:diguanylate cyclase domain-containing protein n=1 Tax=Nakamurella alba TaxID=2665158 RepID=UPI0018A94BCD|nr:sensor domain-containing diguanylate cyclase [Nakamurella alba]
MALDQLSQGVAELATLAAADFDPHDVLHRLCEVAAQALEVDGAGVMRADGGTTTYVHASSGGVKDLEMLQEVLQEGPCRDALDSGRMIIAGTIQDMAWPAFQRMATTVDLHAVLAVPLLSRGRAWGTLDLYWNSPHHITDDDIAAAQLLANVAVSFLVMSSDRAQLQAAHNDLRHRALHDQLTGLANRELMHQHIDHALAAARRNDTLIAVLFVDLDDFKSINDTFGHRAGDHVLATAAQRLQSCIREMDIAGRLAGDEFLILCENITPLATAIHSMQTLAHRIHQSLDQPLEVQGVELRLRASIGASLTNGSTTVEALIHHADTAMYRAKTAGPGGTAIRLLDH